MARRLLFGGGGDEAAPVAPQPGPAGDTGFDYAPPVPPPVTGAAAAAPPLTPDTVIDGSDRVDLRHRRDQLRQRVAELQFDLGGLVYEMAIRDRVRVDVIVRRAATLQSADAELGEIERILHMEETSTAGSCSNCGAPHSSGAGYCWQCGQPLLEQISTNQIG